MPSLTHDGLERKYSLHAPDARAGDEPRPLVIALHGGRANGRQMMRLTRRGFNKLAERDGFLVAYPDGHTMHWTDGSDPEEVFEGDEDSDDVGFLAALIDKLARESSVDPKRVYVTGISNGALMAIRFAMERAEKVAAIASVAGAM
ncbi:MAG: CE1 family esterase, partial [Planctomycetota bacterium]